MEVEEGEEAQGTSVAAGRRGHCCVGRSWRRLRHGGHSGCAAGRVAVADVFRIARGDHLDAQVVERLPEIAVNRNFYHTLKFD